MQSFIKFMKDKYKHRPDKDNMFCVGITDEEFRRFAIEYLLGEDWYCVDPLGRTQINEVALTEILEKYSKRYRKEMEKKKKIEREKLRKMIRRCKEALENELTN